MGFEGIECDCYIRAIGQGLRGENLDRDLFRLLQYAAPRPMPARLKVKKC